MHPGIHEGDWTPVPVHAADAYLAAGFWTHDTLGDIARTHSTTRARRTAVVDTRHRWSFERLEEEVARLAAGWTHAGVVPGTTAVVHLSGCAELVAVLLSLWRVGAVPVMALPAHRGAELTSFVEQSRAQVYVSTDAILDPRGPTRADPLALAAELRRVAPGLLHVVVGDAPDAPDRTTYAALRAHGPSATDEPVDVDPSAVALLQLSGGSTGTPKLIPRTHADYLYSVRACVEACEITGDDVYLCVLPSTHNFALSSAGILGQLLAGGTVVMATDPSAAQVFDVVTREHVTLTGVVPPIVLLWLAAAAKVRGPRPLAGLRLLQVGGARLSDEIARRVQPELGVSLQQVFGMAEGLVCCTRPTDPDEVATTCQGRALSPADEIRIVDDAGADVRPGEPGHLLTRGPYTIRSYFRAPEHDVRAFTPDGFYRTGDIVHATPEGNLVVVGRTKDQINRGGEKIATEEIENHLLAHPWVREAAVVGEPDTLLGERVVAHVVLHDDLAAAAWRQLTGPGLTREVRRFLATRRLAPFKLPDRAQLVPDLPRTAVGKTSLATLRGTR